MKALERKLLICSQIHNGYESEGYHILHTGGKFTIKHGTKIVEIERDDLPQSNKAREFQKMLKEFLTVSFPK